MWKSTRRSSAFTAAVAVVSFGACLGVPGWASAADDGAQAAPPVDTEFATWAPAEGDAGAAKFLEWLRKAQPGDTAP